MVRTSRPYSCSPPCATADASPAIPAGGPYDSPNTAQPPCTTTWAWTPPTTTRGPTTQPDRPSPTCDDCASERRRTFRWPAPHRRDRRPARAAGVQAQVSSSLLDQVQQNPAQREAALRRAHVQRDGCRHNRVAALSLSGIVGQQIGHGEVLGHVQLTVGVALAPVEDQTILTGEDVAHPRTLHIGQVAYHSGQR